VFLEFLVFREFLEYQECPESRVGQADLEEGNTTVHCSYTQSRKQAKWIEDVAEIAS